MLTKELETLKRLASSSRGRGNSGSLFAKLHMADAQNIDRVINLLETNAKALKKCEHCGRLFFATRSKSFCSVNCRVKSFNKNKKKPAYETL